MNCVSTFITLCTIYRSEESTEKVPEPEADVGECEGMVAGFSFSKESSGTHCIVYKDKDDGYEAC